MTPSQAYRISGLASLIGAITFAVHIVLRSVITAGLDPSASAQHGLWVPINLLGVVSAVLVLYGLPAIYARVADKAGLSGFVGTALVALAWMFFGLFLSLYAVLVSPWLANGAPALVAASAPIPTAFLIAFLVGLAAWITGAVLLAVPFIRGRVHPRWIGYLLPVSALWVVVGNLVIAPSGPASNLAVNLLSNLGPVLLVIGIGYLGSQVWSEQPA
jgi:hypothetical protein